MPDDLAVEAAAYCDRCGDLLDGSDHTACVTARRLEPPRYCPTCRRRLVVQVMPVGWSARCSVHGTTRSGQGVTAQQG